MSFSHEEDPSFTREYTFIDGNGGIHIAPFDVEVFELDEDERTLGMGKVVGSVALGPLDLGVTDEEEIEAKRFPVIEIVDPTDGLTYSIAEDFCYWKLPDAERVKLLKDGTLSVASIRDYLDTLEKENAGFDLLGLDEEIDTPLPGLDGLEELGRPQPDVISGLDLVVFEEDPEDLGNPDNYMSKPLPGLDSIEHLDFKPGEEI